MRTEDNWGKQFRKFRLAGGYRSQGAWVDAASALVASLTSAEFSKLHTTFDTDNNAFELSQTMLSRWETGARKPPRERSRHLSIVWILARLSCVQSSDEVDGWLSMADLKPLTNEERAQIWPELIETNVESSSHESPALSTAKQVDPKTEPASVQIGDWGEAPQVDIFYGRSAEQAQVQTWLVHDQNKLVGIWGMGGQGKTTFAAKICREVANSFDGIIWRSLLNAPPLDDILGSWIQLLSNKRLFELPVTLNERLLMLFELLRERRYLLVLDNVESILEADDHLGRYQPGYESYGQLLLRFGETSHKSCLLLTSREEPREFTRLRSQASQSNNPSIRTLRLEGLDAKASEALMMAGISQGTPSSIQKLWKQYSGHPLALMLVSSTITELYGGDIDLFLTQEPGFFSDIQELLTQHVDRVTTSELSILFWLAIEREPVSTQTLRDNLVLSIEQSQLMISLRSLQRRSLIENHPDPQSQVPKFTVQNVVTEYLIDRIVKEASADFLSKESYKELESGKWGDQSFLYLHALVKVTSKSYVRHSQERLILRPVAEDLLARIGRKELRTVLMQRLETLRSVGITVGYTAGNILNLLLYLQEELKGLDFSHLPVWQAALDAKELQYVNFAYADLSDSVFYQNFARVISLAFHPNNNTLFVGTIHGQIGAYNMDTMRPVDKQSGPLHQHILSLQISRDAKTLVSCGDRIVHIWDIYSHGDMDAEAEDQTSQGTSFLKRRYQFEEKDRVRATVLCANDSIIALGCANDIQLRDLRTGDLLETLVGHIGAVSSLVYAPKSGLLISGGMSNQFLIWRVEPLEKKPIAALSTPPSNILNIDISPDGNLLAAAGYNGVVYLWDISKIGQGKEAPEDGLQPQSALTGHTSKVNMVSFSQNGQLLASVSNDRTIRIWEVATGQTRHLLLGHHDEVDTVQFSANGVHIATSSGDRTLRLWDIATGREVRTMGSYTDGSISALDFSPDGQGLISGSDDGTVRVWDLPTLQCKHLFREQTNFIFEVAYDPINNTLASASLDQTICVWDAKMGQLIHKLMGHKGEVTSVAYHPTLPLLISGSNDQTVRLWDTESGALLHTWSSRGGGVWSVAFSPNGESVAAGCSAGVVSFWDLKSRQFTNELSHHHDFVWAIAFSPNGQYIASAGYEGIICLCELADDEKGTPAPVKLNHGRWVQSLAFSPDSRQLVSTGDNREICLWDVQTGQNIHQWPGKDSAVFHPLGHLIAASADQRLIHLWDAATGKLVDQLESNGPFHGTNITGVRGISSAQVETLKLMGAVEDL